MSLLLVFGRVLGCLFLSFVYSLGRVIKIIFKTKTKPTKKNQGPKFGLVASATSPFLKLFSGKIVFKIARARFTASAVKTRILNAFQVLFLQEECIILGMFFCCVMYYIYIFLSLIYNLSKNLTEGMATINDKTQL